MNINKGRIAPRPSTPSPVKSLKPERRTAQRSAQPHQVSAFERPRATVARVLATAVAASPAPPPPAQKKGFWQKLSDFASGVVKTVGNAAASVVKTVGNAAASVVRKIAPRLADAASSLLGGVVNTVVGVGRNIAESLGTIGSGIGKVFKGDFLGGLGTIASGLVKGLVQTPVDAVLMMGGRALSAIQTLVGAEPPGRKLSAEELAVARQVYGDSIDLSKVRIKTGEVGLLGSSGRAFVHGDTIYVPTASLNPDGSIPEGVLAHELGHVWQHQHGGTDYMSEALWAQKFGDGYDWKKGIDQGKSFGQLNPEQQAQFVSTAFEAGYFSNPAAGFTVDGVDYTAQLQAALADIKAGRGAP